jgi:hypothetical protein
VRKTSSAVNLSVYKDGGLPGTGIPEILDIEANVAETRMSCHIMKNCPETASIV